MERTAGAPPARRRHASNARLICARLLAAVLAALLAATLLPEGATAAGASGLHPLRASQISRRLTHEVVGFLPYWQMGNGLESYLRYDLLSTISFFSVGLGADGRVTTADPGYRAFTGAQATRVIGAAHAAGVRVEPTFTSFGAARNHGLLHSRTSQLRAVAAAAGLVRSRGADGATLDLEGIRTSDYGAFGTFVKRLKAALRRNDPIARLTVATSADATGARLARLALANGADRILIMGYDYRMARTATTGGLAPLSRSGGGMSLTWTLDVYASAGVPVARTLLGLPYYGMTWPTRTPALGARPLLDPARYGAVRPFIVASLDLLTGVVRRDYDPVEATGRLLRYDSIHKVWLQTYYETPQGLAAKYGLATRRGLAGVGLWALGYDAGRSDYWNALRLAFGRYAPPRMKVLRVSWLPRTRTWSVRFAAMAPATTTGYEVRLRLPGGSWRTLLSGSTRTSLSLAPFAGRHWIIQARARDGQGRWSAWATWSS